MAWSGYIDVGDGCWWANVLVTRFGCWWQVTSPTSRVRHQHQISVTNITFCRIMMLVTDVSPSGSVWRWQKNYWIWHLVEFHVSNITYRSPTSHSGILWCWWPIGMSPTCRKMTPSYFFCHQHLKMVIITKSPTSPCHQHHCHGLKRWKLYRVNRWCRFQIWYFHRPVITESTGYHFRLFKIED